MENVSSFKIASIGKVAENKLLSSKVISVVLIEKLNLINNELRSTPESIEATGEDHRGQAFGTNIAVDNVVEATWLPFGTNRKTAPDVRRGERVLVWSNGDADKYYWTTTGLDDDLRKLETVLWCFSANPSEAINGHDFDNCYFLEVSTHTKAVTFQTAIKNGEPFQYLFQFNTGEGNVVLQDDIGNMFELDSGEKRFSLHNAAHSKFDMKAGKISIEAPEELSITVGGTRMVFTPGATTLKTPIFAGNS